MTEIGLKATSKALVESLCCDDDAQATLCTQLLRLLAEGRPVSPTRLATTRQQSRAVVEQTLKQLPNIEFDNWGDIIASGLSLLSVEDAYAMARLLARTRYRPAVV